MKRIRISNDAVNSDLVTHNGKFHADDLFSTIFLSKLLDKDEISICRTSTVEKANGIVYDIGDGEFDHHCSIKIRDNGIKYAAFGLLWNKYGKDYLKKNNYNNIDKIFDLFEKKLVMFIDAYDNGQVPPIINSEYEVYNISKILGLFNPNWDSKKNSDECFIDALKMAEVIFDLILENIVSRINAIEIVEEAICKADQIMILDRGLPWKNILLESDNEKAKNILFVIVPCDRGGYNIQTVPKGKDLLEPRKSFRSEWFGKREQLKQMTGIESFRFCHQNGFIAVTDNLEDAIKVVSLCLEDNYEC